MNEPLPKFILLIPLTQNDGTEVPKGVILDFQEELFALGGGFTEAGIVRGAYRMEDGSKQMDQSLEVWVGLPEECVQELERLVGCLGTKLGQETMYFERTGGAIHFIPAQ